MTKRRALRRMAAMLLCVFLCLGMALSMMGVAYAADVDATPSGISIEIMLPSDWANASAAAKLCVTDETVGGFASVEVRIDRSGSWRDITASLEQREGRYYGVVNITDNCTVYVRVTGHDGEVYENSRYMECFDRTSPTVKASVSGDALRVEASDDLSGLAQITVAGKCYTNLTGGTLDVQLKDLGNIEYISVQAADKAGNYSQTVQVSNPNYQAPAASQPTASQPAQTQTTTASAPAASTTPAKPSATSATPSTTTTATPSASANAVQEPDDAGNGQAEQSAKPLTPDGQGTVVDDVTDADSKEFFTFTTPNENIFYLIIDKQRDSDNVYFLNSVTESDLLALAEKDQEQETPEVSAIPDPEPICTCTDKCVAGEVNTDCEVCVLSLKNCTGKAAAVDPAVDPEPEKSEKDSGGTVILILIAALAVGGAGYYIKIYKPKHDLDDAEDFDELTGEDEETVNEDEEPAPRRDAYGEPEEPDYPDGYGYEEPEDVG